MQLGRIPSPPIAWPLAPSSSSDSSPAASAEPARGSSLLTIALEWLKEDRTLRKKMEADEGRTQRGARAETRNAKTFFEKYDYTAGAPRRD